MCDRRTSSAAAGEPDGCPEWPAPRTDPGSDRPELTLVSSHAPCFRLTCATKRAKNASSRIASFTDGENQPPGTTHHPRDGLARSARRERLRSIKGRNFSITMVASELHGGGTPSWKTSLGRPRLEDLAWKTSR